MRRESARSPRMLTSYDSVVRLPSVSPYSTLAVCVKAKPPNPRVALSPRLMLVKSEFPEAFTSPKSKDRKSTRLNSSHQIISYAVFCLKKKKKSQTLPQFKCSDSGESYENDNTYY